MRTTGKGIAIGTAAAGIFLVGLAVFDARDRIAEEWCIYRLRKGDGPAKIAALEGLGQHGSERAILALWELFIEEINPPIILGRWRRDYTGAGPVDPLPFDRSTDIFKAHSKAMARLMKRIPWEKAERAMAGVPRSREWSPRLRIYAARLAVAGQFMVDPGEETRAAAIRILHLGLASPDPVCRAGAALGMADAGEPGHPAMTEIVALQNDPEEIVRAAAVDTLRKIRGEE